MFAAHQAQLAIIFMWSSIPLLQVAWQGNFEQWAANPAVTPVAHAIRDPHFGASAVSAFGAQIVCTTGVYEWYYTIGLRTAGQCIVAASIGAYQSPGTRVLSAGDAFINHHLGGFLGASSVAWAGHLVHVALPASRGQAVGWGNLLHQLPHPAGLKPFVSLDWAVYSSGQDQWNHVFGLADASVGTSVLSFLGTRMPSSDALWLTDVAHHHLALGVLCIFLGNTVRAFALNRDQCGLHWYLAISLAALGTASSFAATHIDAFTVYAYLTKDFTAMSAIYTHHQYIAGFFLLGAFAHGAIYLVRDANLTPGAASNSLRARFVSGLLQYRSAILSHLSAITLFLGFHTLGLYVHNDVMQAFGTPGV